MSSLQKTIVYICGPATHGKTTSAKLAKKNYPKWEIMKIGEPIKKIASIITSNPNQEQDKEFCSNYDPTLTNRDIQIKISNGLMKEFGPDIWTNIFITKLQTINSRFIIVDDARFPGQIDGVKSAFPDYKIITIKLINPRKKDISTEPTERSLDNYEFDIKFSNNGTLDDLEIKIKSIFVHL